MATRRRAGVAIDPSTVIVAMRDTQCRRRARARVGCAAVRITVPCHGPPARFVQRTIATRVWRSQLVCVMGAARPAPIDDGIVRRFTRGTEKPRGILWFGALSFWGHLRHLVSSAIAAESIDSRDWMTPDDPETLRSRIVRILGGGGQG